METDAQITSDGKFVSMYDLTVDRTTDGTGTIASQTLSQLKLFDAGPWSSFQLRRATNLAGPFSRIPGLAPAALGGGNDRYDYSPTHPTSEYFRIEGL